MTSVTLLCVPLFFDEAFLPGSAAIGKSNDVNTLGQVSYRQFKAWTWISLYRVAEQYFASHVRNGDA